MVMTADASPTKPVALLSMTPDLRTAVFPTDLLRRARQRMDLVVSEDFRSDPLLPRCELLFTSWGAPAVTEAVAASAPQLRGVFHAAGSVRAVIPRSVVDSAIAVSSAARAAQHITAQVAYAYIVLGARRTASLAAEYRAGRFSRRAARLDAGFDGKVTGIIGASRIGREVIRRLTDDDRRVLVSDPYCSAEDARRLGVELCALDDLCRRSDIVSVHAPELPETHHLLDARRLALMPDGGVVVNTARGSLIDTDALVAECAAGRLDAYLDVTAPEPLPAGHPLLNLPNVFVSPHLAGTQGTELARMGEFAVDEAFRLLDGRPLLGRIQPGEFDRLA